jgi:cytochrome c556
MVRKWILTTLFCTAGITVALAQAGKLPSTVLMGDVSELTYRTLNGMVKGEAPFDKAKVEEALTKLSADVDKIPAAFPESSKGKKSPDSKYTTSSKMWEQPDDVKDKVAKLKQIIESDRGKIDTLDQLKAAYPALNNACNACHETYRLRAS